MLHLRCFHSLVYKLLWTVTLSERLPIRTCFVPPNRRNRFFERLWLHKKLLTRSIYSHISANCDIVLHEKLCKTKHLAPAVFKWFFLSLLLCMKSCFLLWHCVADYWRWYLACLYRMYHCFDVQLWFLLLKNNYCSTMITVSSQNFKTLKW